MFFLHCGFFLLKYDEVFLVVCALLLFSEKLTIKFLLLNLYTSIRLNNEHNIFLMILFTF